MRYRVKADTTNGEKEAIDEMATQSEPYTAGPPATLQATPPDGENDTSETSSGVQASKADAAAIMTSTIGMMIKAGWVVSVGQDGGRAFCVIEDATWTETAAGWMLREVAK